MPGRFITLEGGEGVGKSTQLRKLAEAIRARGHKVVETREPGGSPGAEAVRKLLLERSAERSSIEPEALLFAAARSDHVRATIRPAVERGEWVVCDRFLDSSLAYQGGAGGMGFEAICQLHEVGSGGFLPDRTLLMRLPEGKASKRTRKRDRGGTDRIGGRGGSFHAEVDAAFLSLAEAEPERFRIVDADAPQAEVTKRLVAALEDLL